MEQKTKYEIMIWAMILIPFSILITQINYMTPFPFTIHNLLFVIAFITLGVFMGFVIFTPKEKLKEIMK